MSRGAIVLFLFRRNQAHLNFGMDKDLTWGNGVNYFQLPSILDVYL